MRDGSAFTFRVDAEGGSDLVAFGYYNIDSLVLEGKKIAVNVVGTPTPGQIYKLFVFKRGGLKTTDTIRSGLNDGLVAGTGFGPYVPTFYYDEEDFGGIGMISMTVDMP